MSFGIIVFIIGNCGKGVHLRLINTDSFIMHNKTEDFYKDIANEVKKRFESSNYKVDSPLGMGEKQKVLDMMKNQLGVLLMKEFICLRPKK